MYKLYNGDCLEVMDTLIKEGTKVDAIITDPPFGTTSCAWDSIISFDKMWERLLKLIRLNGNIVLFGNQPFTSELIHSNLSWFSHSLVWEKEQATNPFLANRQPMRVHEDIIIFSNPNIYNNDNFKYLRSLFKDILLKLNMNKKDIQNKLGGGFDHCFRTNSSQWSLPTEKNYNLLRKTFNLDIPVYQELYSQYRKEIGTKTYNPQFTEGKPYSTKRDNKEETEKIFNSKIKRTDTYNEGKRYPTSILRFNRETKNRLHPTQKPIDLMEYLVKTYTNENETVLDFTMGSGSTGVACINTKRDFIGIELDKTYYGIAEKRIKEADTSIFDI